jgi:ubiquinone/menaquinone biosynthesis C-methylase UbiE
MKKQLKLLKQFMAPILERKLMYEKDLDPKVGYGLWAQNYDNEKNNLMHLIDERSISQFLSKGMFVGKIIADFGCGTGRNWPLYLNSGLSRLVGFDVSSEMLNLLKVKFPKAETLLIQPDQSLPCEEKSIDIIISTLVIEHVADLELLFEDWSKILKNDAEIIITGYHPAGLSNGGVISFTIEKKSYRIVKHIHSLEHLLKVAIKYRFEKVFLKEIKIDESLKSYYQEANALHLYEKYEGTPLYFAIHLKRYAKVN